MFFFIKSAKFLCFYFTMFTNRKCSQLKQKMGVTRSKSQVFYKTENQIPNQFKQFNNQSIISKETFLIFLFNQAKAMRQTKLILIRLVRISTREHLQHTEQGRESTRPVLPYPPPGVQNPNQTNPSYNVQINISLDFSFFKLLILEQTRQSSNSGVL